MAERGQRRRPRSPLVDPSVVRNRAYTLLGANRPWRDMLIRHRAAGPRQFLTTAVSMLLSWLLVGQVIALVVTLLAQALSVVEAMECTDSEAAFDARTAVALPSAQHRPCEGRRLQQWRRPLRPSPPGKDDRLHGPLPTTGSRRPAYAQGGLRGDGAQCPGLPGRESIRNSTSFPTTPMSAWALPSSCRFMDRPSTSPRWRTRFAGSSSTTRTAIESSPPRRDDAAFREHVYNQQSRVVVLRLYLLAKPKSSYFVHRETL